MFIVRDESVASQRVVPLWCVGSDGTTPAAGEAAGQPQFMIGGVFYGDTTATLSAWSAAAGQYFVTLTQSECSILGPGVVRYSSANALETETPFILVAANSYNSQDLGLDGVNVASFDAGAITAAAIATNAIDADAIADNAIDAGAIAANAITAAKIATDAITTDKIAAGTYSDVTFSVGGTAASLVTLAPGSHSDVTIQGVTRTLNLTTNDDKAGYTITAGTYSNVTFSAGGLAPSLVTLAPGSHSDVTTGYNVSSIDANTIDASAIAANAITSSELADGALTAAKFDSNASILLQPTVHSGASVGIIAATHPGVTIPTVTDVTNAVTTGTISANAINAAAIATGAIDADAIADNAIDAGAIAANAITSAKIATDAIGTAQIAAGTYSGTTFGSAATILAGGIAAASFGASAIDAAALATDAGQEIADRLLLRDVAGGADSARSVGQALYALRNRVEVGDSVMTVYQADDTNSAWTASATTAAFPLGEINPQ
jgi:hypothetical protein